MPATRLRINQMSEGLRDGSSNAKIGSTPVIRTISGNPRVDWSEKSVEGILLPSGLSSERPAATDSLTRYNSDLDQTEVYLPRAKVWVPLQGRHNRKSICSSYIEDDFLGSTFNGVMGWSGVTNGGGGPAAGLNTAWTTTDQNFIGTARVYTGTGNTSEARLVLGRMYLPRVAVSGVASQYVMWSMFARLQIPILSTATPRFHVRLGLCEEVFPYVSTNERLMLSYQDNVNGGKWLAENYATALASADTGVLASTATVTLGLVYLSDNTSGSLIETVHYYVNSDTPVATVSTQIPFDILLRPIIMIKKVNGGSARSAYIDHVAIETAGDRD